MDDILSRVFIVAPALPALFIVAETSIRMTPVLRGASQLTHIPRIRQQLYFAIAFVCIGALAVPSQIEIHWLVAAIVLFPIGCYVYVRRLLRRLT